MQKDIASHPIAQMKARESPGVILTVLGAQVETFDKSQSADENLTKRLDLSVNVLYAFSAVLGDAVGLVIARVLRGRDSFSDVCRRCFHRRV